MYIFLDIDGVFIKLGKEFAKLIDMDEEVPSLDSVCINYFFNVIEKYDGVKIVISSSWRETYDVPTIKSRFPENIREKIEGVTSILPYLHEPVEFFRYQEVLDYLKKANAVDELWVAIDDIAENYPPDVRIITTNPYVGFDNTAALKLDSFLKAA